MQHVDPSRQNLLLLLVSQKGITFQPPQFFPNRKQKVWDSSRKPRRTANKVMKITKSCMLEMLACKKKSLPLSVKILHLDVCMFDMIEPSSTLRNPIMPSPSALLSKLDSVEISFAKTGLAFIPRIIAASQKNITSAFFPIVNWISKQFLLVQNPNETGTLQHQRMPTPCENTWISFFFFFTSNYIKSINNDIKSDFIQVEGTKKKV